MSESVIQNRAGFDRIQWAIVFRALLPFAFGYFMSYLFWAVNQVIAPDRAPPKA